MLRPLLSYKEEREGEQNEEERELLDERITDYIRAKLARGEDVHVLSIAARFGVNRERAQSVLDDCIRARVLSQRPDAVPIRAFQRKQQAEEQEDERERPGDIEMTTISHRRHSHTHQGERKRAEVNRRDVKRKTRKERKEQERRKFDQLDEECDDHEAFMAKLKEFATT